MEVVIRTGVKQTHTKKRFMVGASLVLLTSLTVSLCFSVLGGIGGTFGPQTASAAPVTFTVTNTNDTGAGSLRQAITDANSNGNPGDQDVIEFGIAGGGTKTITPQTDITITESVRINGYTQPNASQNTATFPDPLNGVIRIQLFFSNGDGFNINAPQVNMEGIAASQPASIGDSFHPILNLNGANNFKLFGSYIGSDFTGLNSYTTTDIARNGMIEVQNSSNTQFGSDNNNDRNIFGMCGGTCLYATGSPNLILKGTNIGVGADGLSPFYGDSGFGKMGIYLGPGSNNALIGDNQGGGNYFYYLDKGAIFAKDVSGLNMYGNLFYRNSNVIPDPLNNPNFRLGVVTLLGVQNSIIGSAGQGTNKFAGNYGNVIMAGDSLTNSSNLTITNNEMGYNYNKTSPLANCGFMIDVFDNTRDVLIQNNILHNSQASVCGGQSAVKVENNAQNISMLGNSIHNVSGFGIELNSDGYSPNDNNDVDTGPNGMLNNPGYTQITENAGNTNVNFTLDVPAGQYRIEFFSNSINAKEGETYLGFVNITHTGTGLEAFSHTVSGINHTNMTLTATEINPSTPSGFGATSEFGTTGQVIPPPPPVVTPADLSLSMRLLNPQDKALGNILRYEIKISNLGPNNFNLSSLNQIVGNEDTLFSGIIPPQLQYSGISGPSISCHDYGLGSASMFGPILANHSDHSIITCGHTGNNVLVSGGSVSYIMSTTVIDLTNPTFTAHALVAVSASSNQAFDPDAPTINSIVNGGGDLIDGLSSNFVNNYDKASTHIADISASGGLDNPQDVAPGANLNYTVTLTNNGPLAIDPTIFDLSGINPFITSLFIGVLPPNLTYVSQNNPDLNCTWSGPGSASLTPFFAQHSDYSLIVCGYFGNDTSLTTGESISTTFRLTTSAPPSSFSAYFIGNGTPLDDGLVDITRAFQLPSPIDAIDALRIYNPNNFLISSYNRISTSPGREGNIASTSIQRMLSKTGDKIYIPIVIAVIMIAITILVAVKRQKK